MSARDLVALIHLAGFATGIALYGMLALMTRRSARHDQPVATGGGIAILAALLGILWNAGALVVYGWQDFNLGQLSPWITVVSYSALGFLPAVVVDSATRSPEPRSKPSALALCAYALSAAATILQVVSVAEAGVVSTTSLLTLTIGYITIVALVAIKSVGRTGSQRALTAVALAAFAVSAFHLSRHSNTSDTSWMVELIGHHASLPLVLVILYQDYRFAFADIFLKRALAILALVAVVCRLTYCFSRRCSRPTHRAFRSDCPRCCSPHGLPRRSLIHCYSAASMALSIGWFWVERIIGASARRWSRSSRRQRPSRTRWRADASAPASRWGRMTRPGRSMTRHHGMTGFSSLAMEAARRSASRRPSLPRT